MTPIEIRHSVLTLHQQGNSLRDIARLLHLSSNTVRAVLRPAPPPSADTGDDEPMRQRLREAYARAKGNTVRMAQILADERDLRPPYSTLTRWVRQAELR